VSHTTRTFTEALDALERSDAVFEEPRAGDTTSVGSLRFAFANPPAQGAGGLHDNGLVFRVGYGDVTFLFTGDAEQPTEHRMVADHAPLLRADVYQVGHHGSSTSTGPALLEAVSPRIAVYSAGRDNPYGHPHEEVVERLAASGAEVFGTPVHGTVVVTTDGRSLRVSTAAGLRIGGRVDGKGRAHAG
jgi:competence protein ComEC